MIFSKGCEKLLINVFIIFRFHLSYMESCLVVAKILELPGSGAVNIFRNGPVNDVVLRLRPTVASICFLNQLKTDTKQQQNSEHVCFGQGEGYGLFGLILAALLLPGKNDSLLFHPELFHV